MDHAESDSRENYDGSLFVRGHIDPGMRRGEKCFFVGYFFCFRFSPVPTRFSPDAVAFAPECWAPLVKVQVPPWPGASGRRRTKDAAAPTTYTRCRRVKGTCDVYRFLRRLPRTMRLNTFKRHVFLRAWRSEGSVACSERRGCGGRDRKSPGSGRASVSLSGCDRGGKGEGVFENR